MLDYTATKPVRKKALRELFDEFINAQTYVARRSPETIKGYCAAFELLLKLVPTISLQSIQDEKLFVSFFALLENRERVVGKGTKVQGVRKTTIATYMSKLRTFLTWLLNGGHIKKHPFANLPAPNVEYTDRRYLQSEQIQAILHTCRYQMDWANEFIQIRNYTIFMMLLNIGLRRNEVLSLRMDDVDMEKRLVRVRAETSKSQRERRVPINHELFEALEHYIRVRKEHQPESYAFFVSDNGKNGLSHDGLKHVIEKVKEASGVPFHAHQFRHTFAMNLLSKNVNIASIKQLMGHKDIRMTSAYLRQIPTDTLRADLELLTVGGLI